MTGSRPDACARLAVMTLPQAAPRYVVIFTSHHSGEKVAAYKTMAARMIELAQTIDGFCGIESARSEDGLGITNSYWASLEAIEQWRTHPEHLEAQRLGRDLWYSDFALHVAEIQRTTTFSSQDG